MGLLIRLAANALAVWLAVLIVPGLDFTGDAWALVGLAVILAAVNAVVRPVLTFLTLPAVILTLGLFLLVVNAIALSIVVWISGELDLGLTSTGFGANFFGAIVVSIVTWAGEVSSRRERRRGARARR
jgi:putative membrane protein